MSKVTTEKPPELEAFMEKVVVDMFSVAVPEMEPLANTKPSGKSGVNRQDSTAPPAFEALATVISSSTVSDTSAIVSEGAGSFTVSVMVVTAEPTELFAYTVNTVASVRLSVGKPLMTPLANERPVGRSGVISQTSAAASLPTVELQSLKLASRSPTREVGSNVMVLGLVRTSRSTVVVAFPPGPIAVMVCSVCG